MTPPAHRDLMTRKANPVTRGGIVCGTWARRGDELRVSWLDGTTRPDAALEEEGTRLAALLGRELQVRVTS